MNLVVLLVPVMRILGAVIVVVSCATLLRLGLAKGGAPALFGFWMALMLVAASEQLRILYEISEGSHGRR